MLTTYKTFYDYVKLERQTEEVNKEELSTSDNSKDDVSGKKIHD